MDQVIKISGAALKGRIKDLEEEHDIEITACDESGNKVTIADLPVYRVSNHIAIVEGEVNGWK